MNAVARLRPTFIRRVIAIIALVLTAGMLTAAPAHAAGTVSGVVRDSAGQLASGAQVEIRNNQGVTQGTPVYTVSDGTYSIPAVAGTWNVVASPANGSPDVASNPVSVTVTDGQATANNNLSLRAATVVGHVYQPSPSTNGVNGAQVEVVDGSQNIIASGVTDNSGAYKLAVPSGSYNIRAHPGMNNFSDSTSYNVTVANPIVSTVTVDMNLQPGGNQGGGGGNQGPANTFSGHIYQPGSSTTAVSGAQVSLQQGFQNIDSDVSANDGSFSLGGSAGTYTLSISAPTNSSYASASDVTVVLAQDGSLVSPSPLNVHLNNANVSGHVYEPGSSTSPVVNAQVQAHTQNNSFSTTGSTGTDGSYHLYVPAGTYVLDARPQFNSSFGPSVSGTLTVPNSGSPTATPSLDLHLQVLNIHGHVLEPGSSTNPVPNAFVSINNSDNSFNTGTPTDNSGAFALAAPAGTYTLTANPPQSSAFAGSTPITVVIANDGSVTSPNSLDVHLTTPNVNGHVYEPGSSTTPVQNSGVQVHSSDYSYFVNAQTDNTGAFHLTIAPGNYFISASPPQGNSVFTNSAEVPLQIANNGTATTTGSLTLHLLTPNVSSTVVDPSNNPVGNTNIQVRSADYRFQQQTQAGQDGTFRMTLGVGTYVINASPPGGNTSLGRSADVTFTVASNGTVGGLPAHLALRTPNVTGQVLLPGSSSTGIANANINVRSSSDPTFNAGAQGDGTGHFAMTLAPGTYLFTGDPGQNSQYAKSAEATVVVPQSGSVAVPLHTTVPNVSGTVRGPSPATTGLANIGINVRSVDKPVSYNSQTNNSGVYHLSLPAGEYVVSASPQQGASYTPSVDTSLVIAHDGDTATLDLRLTNPNVGGTVVQSDGNTPAQSANISLQNNTTGFFANAQTDNNGQFQLFAPAGTYELRASAPSGSTDSGSDVQTVTVGNNGTGPLNLQVALTQPNVSGVVLAPGNSNTRVGNVNVSIHTSDWSVFLNTQADSNGNFRFNVPEGDYVVTAEPPYGNAQYGRSLDAAVTVGATGVASVTARLTNPNVTGTVYLPNGDPVANANVNVRSDDNSFFTNAQTDSQGTFRVTVPSGGTYFADAQPPQGNSLSGSGPVQLTVNQNGVLTAPIPLALSLTQPSLVGQVFDPGANPNSTSDDVIAGNANVNVHNDDYSVQVNAQVRQDGRFSIGGLAPGTYTLEVSPPYGSAGLLRTSFPVTVPGSGTPLPVTVENSAGTGRVYLGVASQNITVSVKRDDNSAITTDAHVQAFNDDGGFVDSNTPNGSGYYSLKVGPGNWKVAVQSTVASNTWVFTDQPPTVDSTTCSTAPCVTLHVQQAQATVTGLVTKPDSSPASANSAYVDVRTPDGKGNGANIGAGGAFSVKVPAGTYSVTVHPNDKNVGQPAPVAVTVATNSSANAGTLQLVARTARLQGRIAFTNPDPNAAPTPVAGAQVFAFMPNGGGFADGITQTDGTFTLNVTPGDWQVGIWSKPTDNWLNEDPLRSVSVAANATTSGINFNVSASAASVKGQVLIPGGGIASVDGYVSLTSASGGGGGAPLTNGSFAIPSKAGTYSVKLYLAPGSPYTAPSDQTVVVGANGTVTPSSTTLQLVANDQQLSGQVVDANGSPITTGNVLVSASRNGFYLETKTDANGHYQLSLAAGTWQLSTRSQDPNYSVTGFRLANNQPAALSTAVATVTLSGGTPTVRNVAVVAASRSIMGTVRNSDNTPANGVWVHVDSSGTGVVPVHTGAYSDASGNFSINVPDGNYDVGASGGSNGQLEPVAQRVSIGASTPSTPLTLNFRPLTSSITGLVRMTSGGAPVGAAVQAWSNSGGYATANSDPNTGAYTLNVSENDTWHVSASVSDATNASHVLVASEQVVPVAVASVSGVNLNVAAITVPNGVRATFDASTAQVVRLGADTPSVFDDVSITVPAGALATSGQVSLVATPNAGPSQTRGTHPVGLGYDFQAFDSNGVPILNTFNRVLTITFGYDPAELTASGLSVTDLVPSYWDPTTRSYRRTDTAVIDTSTNTITFTTDHFTQWVVAAAVTTPGAPTSVVATATSGTATVTWAAPTDTGGSTITSYVVTASPGGATATVAGTLRTAAISGLSNGTSYTFTVKAINAIGTGSQSGASNAVTPAASTTTSPGAGSPGSTTAQTGYRLFGRDGAIYTFGTSLQYGSPASTHLAAPIVGGATTPSNNGYWFVASDGGVFNFGDAGFYGSMGGSHLNAPIVGMAVSPTGHGYWLVASDGGVFSFGDASFYGSTGAIHLNKPIVGITSTPTGHGYWLVAADGGIFAYGDAGFLGSTGSIKLNKPVVSMAATPTGHGYWLVASDGGIFAYGDAPFYGSSASIKLNKPIVAMQATPAGDGYTLIASDGGVFSYGAAPFLGSIASNNIAQPVVGAGR